MRWSSIFFVLSLALLPVIGGCGAEADAPTSTSPDASLRLVSLSPAISRTLVDLGVAEHIVGRSPFCESLDPEIPVVGDLLNLDYERLVRLQPTHVLVQPPAAGIDRRLLSLAEEHGWVVGSWRLDGVDDIKRLLGELPQTLGRDDLIEPAVELELQIDDVLRSSKPSWQGRTLLVAGTEPVGVFGTGTYLHDILTSLGASNAVSLANYPQLTLEDVTRLDPQAIILIRPGAPDSLDPAAALRSLATLDVAAVGDQRVAILTHPDAFLPSSGIVGVAQAMREILDSFGAEEQP